MNLDSLIEIVNRKLIESQNRPLNSTEVLILRGIWEYQTYSKIAEEGGYSAGYLTNVVAPELCKRLSNLIGQRVTKKNCRILLESYAVAQPVSVIQAQRHQFKGVSLETSQEYSQSSLPYPSGAVPLDSPIYVERSSIEEQIYTEIRKPGALVRIKAPKEMGKTSLLLRVLDYAKYQGYRTVSLNLEQTDQAILSDLNRFLRWLCANISSQLQLEPKLDEYWDEDIGSKVSCSLYIRNYLLEQIDSPLVLALDEVNHIFEYPQVAKDFLPLLRSWYEDARRLPICQKLRLIIVHSTEIYVPLQLQQSPFNVGLPIQLTSFSLEQVQQLAQQYGINWADGDEAKQLMDIVGGHPALVNIALYYLNRGEVTLPQLLETASTCTGVYFHHLQRHWITLQEQTELAIALATVINSTEPIPLEPIIAYKLSSMGLIKLDNNQATPSCQLYRQYFQSKLFTK
ncbi:AAA-like domain-containing protein [Nostoc sp.]|uniref:AAA-like domain-containing protein n=1 Tax=Nostoc sp. TaxID=1180 RepID=UPI002FF66947